MRPMRKMKNIFINLPDNSKALIHVDVNNLKQFGQELIDTIYIFCEMKPSQRYTYESIMMHLLNKEKVIFDYHNCEFAALEFDGKQFFLYDIH